MNILVEHNGQMVQVAVVDHFAVKVLIRVGDIKATVRLNQCKKCGVWVSEDDELYGDGFCAECTEMCFDCEQYFNRDTMTPLDDEEYDSEDEYETWFCSECEKKRKEKRENG